ncbi:helix-turn-helix domain-containing protein [Nostoc sp. CHAB 5715]|uniref:helix-turn-helix domain-containing protein n=1 Tax=Nostoc sp. CHAB 5715 TaxID=2780400 RepID=UPI00279609E1|nr:helix-turn-helix domain-containing protein [Nostoc sp. CHAB 5715]MCC5626306.1 helix-turn-helix domain-containing protein [Nostoc sp. CHAB 5715]
MRNILREFEDQAEKISILTAFIESNPEPREMQRALAVKMALQGESYRKITELLSMHKSCITIWKQKFNSLGLDGIKLGYQGAKSYLTPEQTSEIVAWLKTRDYWDIDELVSHLDENYGVIYQYY